MATYAIGDVQACYDELQSLLASIQFDSTKDTLWFTGDLVNRGPHSLLTLRLIKSLNPIVVLGNHDLHLLACFYAKQKLNKGDTLDDILSASDADELCHWLRHQPLIHLDKFCLVHAGIPPQWSLEQAKMHALEVETLLQSEAHIDFYKHMYGNTPLQWDAHLEQWDRFRMITNYFTRMRFCNEYGDLDLENKGQIDTAPTGFRPWFEHPNRQTKNNGIIFGHWAALEGKTTQENAIGLDTGCVWGNKLTAFCLDTKQFFSVPAKA